MYHNLFEMLISQFNVLTNKFRIKYHLTIEADMGLLDFNERNNYIKSLRDKN
jgi:hypothetical protein